jgi:hypothetical protein
MKHLLLLAIVAASIVGATTAFASSNFINITGIQSLGASADVNIPVDITSATVQFSTCQNNEPGTICAGTPVLFGIEDCTITDTTDKNIPAGSQVICKLTTELCPSPHPAGTTDTHTTAGGQEVFQLPNGNLCTDQIAIAGEGTVTVTITPVAAGGFTSNIGGTASATSVDCSVAGAPCVIESTFTTPVDIQEVGDVKVIEKGPLEKPTSFSNTG